MPHTPVTFERYGDRGPDRELQVRVPRASNCRHGLDDWSLAPPSAPRKEGLGDDDWRRLDVATEALTFESG